MKTRTVVIGALLVAVALLGIVALRGENGEKQPKAAAPPISQAEPPKASLPPSRQSDVSKPAAPPIKIEGATSLPTTQSYESSSNLKVLADTLGPGLRSGDAESARTMARILNECAQLMLFPGYAESFRNNLADLSPEQQSTALTHIGRLEQRCSDIDKTEKLTTSNLRDLERRGMGVDDVVALAHRVTADPASLSVSERTDAVRRIVMSRNGEAIYVLADAMEFSDDADNFLLRQHAGQLTDVYAWKLVGCAFGAPCGPDSSFVRQNCITLRKCMPGGYREYIRYYLLSPYSYEVVLKAEQDILSIISSGRTEELLF